MGECRTCKYYTGYEDCCAVFWICHNAESSNYAQTMNPEEKCELYEEEK